MYTFDPAYRAAERPEIVPTSPPGPTPAHGSPAALSPAPAPAAPHSRAAADGVPRASGALARGLLAMALLVALAPMLAAAFDILPGYRVPRLLLAGYASFLSLLAIGYTFYVRHNIARFLLDLHADLGVWAAGMDGDTRFASLRRRARTALVALLPAALLALSGLSLVRYLSLLDESLTAAVATHLDALAHARTAADSLAPGGIPDSAGTAWRAFGTPRRFVLAASGVDAIPYFPRLCLWYLGIFLPAATAAAFMAIREQMQIVLELSELDMIIGAPPGEDPE
ncbi:MAG TPA: hypothetical protein VFS40_07340 [Gemmatimonadales bacterium]|nr:hypothetical protein [Gemmatimonadales bacterium]